MLGTRNQSYTVEQYVQVSPVEIIVLARHDNGHQWCTWIATDMNRRNEWRFYHGHYFLDKTEALIDLWQRIKTYCEQEIAWLQRLED